MANSLVFIFLLDSLPGKILNQSLESVQQAYPEQYSIHKCNYKVTDPLLQIISKELDALVVPSWLTFQEKIQLFNKSNEQNNDDFSDELLNIGKILDTSFEIPKVSAEGERDEFDFIPDLPEDKSDEITLNYTEVDIADVTLDKDALKYPGKVPFLVAIFESLTNVTAQTCAGTLLTSHWVLTAASCVNLLNTMYHNVTNQAQNSTYTIVADAKDPLLDGTAHNVTEIHVNPFPVDLSHYHGTEDLHHGTDDLHHGTENLHHGTENLHHGTEDIHHIKVDSRPTIALMKIDPPVVIEDVELTDDLSLGMPVIVYGWVTDKEKNDSLHATAFEARTISNAECGAHYNLTEDREPSSETCFITSDDNNDLINDINWGGPVVSHTGHVVAVARGDGHAPLAGSPVGLHATWIRHVLHDHDH